MGENSQRGVVVVFYQSFFLSNAGASDGLCG